MSLAGESDLIRLIICEDNDDLRDVLESSYDQDLFSVTLVRDGRDCIEAIERGDKFDFIVADILMQHVGGEELVYYLKERAYDLDRVYLVSGMVYPSHWGPYRLGVKHLNKSTYGSELYQIIKDHQGLIEHSRNPSTSPKV